MVRGHLTVSALCTTAFPASVFIGAAVCAAQTIEIGIVDTYGLRTVAAADVRRALTFAEGDTLQSSGAHQPPAAVVESERRLTSLRGVARAKINLICCEAGRAIAYIGIDEQGSAAVTYREAPRGDDRLADDVVQAGRAFEDALMSAVRRGQSDEDESQGHALASDPAMRAIQDRFIAFAARDFDQLRTVLRDSSDAEQRALSAEILGYTQHKQRIVDDLVAAVGDPSSGVRNNAMRTLAVFAAMKTTPDRPAIRVPTEPFIATLRSFDWTDRNKAAFALAKLSERRDPALLATLRRDAMEPLVEMARWKSRGHAMAALIVLGRIAGLTDDAVERAWSTDERERVIRAAMER